MKTTQKGTEGILNHVCDKYHCNSKSNTIPVQKLIRFHKPKSNSELTELITNHQKDGINSNCKCGCKSNGTVETFGEKLYEAYLKYQIKNPDVLYKNLEDCKIFMRQLFVSLSLKGNAMEDKAVKLLSKVKELKDYKVTLAPNSYDFKYAIDILIKDSEGAEILGVQVKPESYKYANANIRVMNKRKNESYKLPVLYLYYDGKFVGKETFLFELKNIL